MTCLGQIAAYSITFMVAVIVGHFFAIENRSVKGAPLLFFTAGLISFAYATYLMATCDGGA